MLFGSLYYRTRFNEEIQSIPQAQGPRQSSLLPRQTSLAATKKRTENDRKRTKNEPKTIENEPKTIEKKIEKFCTICSFVCLLVRSKNFQTLVHADAIDLV